MCNMYITSTYLNMPKGIGYSMEVDGSSGATGGAGSDGPVRKRKKGMKKPKRNGGRRKGMKKMKVSYA